MFVCSPFGLTCSVLGRFNGLKIIAQKPTHARRYRDACLVGAFRLSTVDVVAEFRAEFFERLIGRESVYYETREHIGCTRPARVGRAHRKRSSQLAHTAVHAARENDLVGVRIVSPIVVGQFSVHTVRRLTLDSELVAKGL